MLYPLPPCERAVFYCFRRDKHCGKFAPKFDYAKVKEQTAREAKERQAEYHGNHYDRKSGVTANLPEVHTKKPAPQTADKIAEKVGVSRNTYNALVRLYKPRRPFLAPWTGKYAINVLERLEQSTEPDINISS